MGAMRLMVSGVVSGAGKTTICMGVMMGLLREGYTHDEIAYIKPATQCQAVQVITKWCDEMKIACCPIGPVVFELGFTYGVLDGTTDPAQLHSSIINAVNDISRNKKIVIIDGVGYPSVGSCAMISNADIARILNAPVLFVGPEGVGHAIDSVNLVIPYFVANRAHVLGVIFNKINMTETARHSLANCKKYVMKYFLRERPSLHIYGFVPDVTPVNMTTGPRACAIRTTSPPPPLDQAEQDLIAALIQVIPSIDMRTLIADVKLYHQIV